MCFISKCALETPGVSGPSRGVSAGCVGEPLRSPLRDKEPPVTHQSLAKATLGTLLTLAVHG